mmetsp:Transcript_71233/g.166779  ORF Transcript_71233/g.166779 Transcript_71233/m.166779 type:complete len:97 (-) Transcript_71233:57-347(-)
MGSVSNQDSCLLSRGASTADTQMIEDEEEEHRRRQRMLYIQALGAVYCTPSSIDIDWKPGTASGGIWSITELMVLWRVCQKPADGLDKSPPKTSSR